VFICAVAIAAVVSARETSGMPLERADPSSEVSSAGAR
jgi:hypothetical protein